MRISFVAANYPPSIGGAQLLIQRVAEGLTRCHGHDVSVVTTDAMLSPGGSEPGLICVSDEVMGGVKVRRRPVARRAHTSVRAVRRLQIRTGARQLLPYTELLSNGPIGFGFVRGVRAAARTSDVVVGVSSSFLTLPLAAVATGSTGAVAVHLPLLHLDAASPRPSVMHALRRADRVVALTDFERGWLIGQAVERSRIEVIPPGCDLYDQVPDPASARRVLGLPDRPTIAYVGRLAPHKGIDTLLAAMERVWAERPDVTLLLAGNRAGWTDLDRLLAASAELAGDRLVVRSGFDDAEKHLLYAAGDVIAFPSREESFGIVILEAWCARRPVVCGDIGAVRSLVRDGTDALLVPVGDVARWAVTLTGLLDDPERRRSLAEAGSGRVPLEFSWPVVLQRWNDLIVEAVTGRRRGSRAVST